MLCIRDKEGLVLSKSSNLRGIREYVGKNIIKVLDISPIAEYEGKLCILFDNGASFETNFASYNVLKDFVRRWRNVYGAPLTVNGSDAGRVEYNNKQLS